MVKRHLGEYTIALKWVPNRTPYTPWAFGMYNWTIRDEWHHHSLGHGTLHVFDKPAGHGVTPEDLGYALKDLGKSHAYDAVARHIIQDLHRQYPNREMYTDMIVSLDESLERGWKRSAKRRST